MMTSIKVEDDSPWRIIRRRVNPLDEIAVRSQFIPGEQYHRRITEYRMVQELGPRFISGPWIGLDRCDGKQRLFRYVPGLTLRRDRFPKGRCMISFSRHKLLRIAWKIGVNNPDGFARDDCNFFGLTDGEGFTHFTLGWKETNKIILGNYIWNHLYDNDAVYSYF